jgi:hypothetical protein
MSAADRICIEEVQAGRLSDVFRGNKNWLPSELARVGVWHTTYVIIHDRLWGPINSQVINAIGRGGYVYKERRQIYNSIKQSVLRSLK